MQLSAGIRALSYTLKLSTKEQGRWTYFVNLILLLPRNSSGYAGLIAPQCFHYTFIKAWKQIQTMPIKRWNHKCYYWNISDFKTTESEKRAAHLWNCKYNSKIIPQSLEFIDKLSCSSVPYFECNLLLTVSLSVSSHSYVCGFMCIFISLMFLFVFLFLFTCYMGFPTWINSLIENISPSNLACLKACHVIKLFK